MKKTMRILTLLAVMAITAGQAWAEAPTYGKIHYTQGGTDGGRLCFSTTLDMTYNDQTDFNGSQVSSGNDWINTYTVTGKTLTDGKVYVRALPSFGYTVTGMTITVEPSAPSSTAEAPRRGAPGVASTIPVTPVEGHSGVYTFPMPTDGTNVTVTASFPVSTPINVDYLDATGTKKTAQAYVLDGAELYLGKSDQEFWYVCNSAIDYRTQLRLYGDTHIILADDATMTISAGTQHAIESTGALTIYGQGGASGKLIAEATSGEGIYSNGDITIISADVSVTSTSSYAVHVNPGNITITDSKVTVNGGLDGFVATNVSGNTTKGNITINGSQVTAIGGTHANDYGINAVGGDITIGWKNTTDFIKASCYFIEGSGNVKTADGKPFIAYTPAATANDSEKQAVLIQGNTTLDANAIAAIAGKVLRPATADDVTVSYMDWDDTQKKLVEKNTCTDSNTANDIVYVLQGGAGEDHNGQIYTELSGGWYVAEGEVAYTGKLQFTGDAHLILADDAEMKVDISNGNEAINCSSSLSIYGQSSGNNMGSLTAISRYNYCINIYNDLSITCCKVSAEGDSSISTGIGCSNNSTLSGAQVTVSGKNGFYCNRSLTVNNSIITAQGTRTGLYTSYSTIVNNGEIYATGGDIGIHYGGPFNINGGKIKAISTGTGSDERQYGIDGYDDFIIGWSDPDNDYVYVSSYQLNGHYAKTAEGKRFIAYNMASENDISANCIIGSATSTTATTIPDYVSLTDANAARTIAGKTLRPLDGYVVEDMAGLAFSGKTAPDFTMSCPFYIYKEDDEVTITTKNYGQNGIKFNTNPYPIGEITAAPGTVLQTATFDMPPCDFTINYVKYYNTDVKYMDWDDTQKKLVEKKTDANTKVYILTGGGATYLDGGWYVANNWNTDATDGTDAAYTGKVTFDDDAHLILADGAEMSITPSSGHGIQSCGDIAIYSQSIGTDMGLLTITTSLNYNAIYTNDDADGDVSITINGGNINTTTNGISPVIYSAANNGTANVTINGGKVNTVNHTDLNGRGISAASFNSVADVTIRGGEVSISTYTDGICTRSNNGTANITISGGQVSCITEAEPGIKASTDFDTANINLSLTNGTDFIKATSYYANSVSGTASVRIPASKALFIDGTETVLGNTDADYVFGDGTNKTLDDIANQTLRPSKDFTVAAGAQYAVVYQEEGDWKVTDSDTKVYVPTGNIIKNATTGAYEMELKEVTGGGIPDGLPVIVGKEGGLGDIPVVGTSAEEATAIETKYNDAVEEIKEEQGDKLPAITFFATNTIETLAQQIINAASPKDAQGNVIAGQEVDPKDYIVLGLVGGKLTTLSANQAAVPSSTQPVVVISKFDFLQMIRGIYSAPTSNAPSIVIDLGDVTGISDIKHETLNIKSDDAWYSLDGRKLNVAPTQKGIYIFNGTKRVVK